VIFPETAAANSQVIMSPSPSSRAHQVRHISSERTRSRECLDRPAALRWHMFLG
jgi:hypothetical protein